MQTGCRTALADGPTDSEGRSDTDEMPADESPLAHSAAPARVAFVHAPDPFYSEMQNNGVLFMPVWAYTLAAHMGDGYALALYDTRFQDPATFDEADVFLYSGINQDAAHLLSVRETLAQRFPAARHVIGGPICWSFDQAGDLAKLDPFDHVVIGDGERLIAGLVAGLVGGDPPERVIRNRDRFPIVESKPMYRPLLGATIDRYYGAVVEVSRGCPFLCEFCDIRVLPDNNRPHNKPAALIVEEIDFLARHGVRHFLFACDNFIGDPRWAEEVVDAILAWQDETGLRSSIYTWLTINLYKMPRLMRKMRHAGFDMLFIGVESFNSNSLLETAKVQNTAADLVGAIREIQSYGFFIVGGLIFGFDSDGSDCFDITLNGILEAGLLSGDPSLLTALPGTPLFRRMKMAGRLRDVRYGLGGYKYQTNIRYLMPRDELISGFRRFVVRLTDGGFQYRRLRAFFDNLDRDNFIPLEGKGYASPRDALKTILTNRRTTVQGLSRIAKFVRRPSNIWWFLRAFAMVAARPRIRGRFGYLMFWWVLWTSVIVKYRAIRADDFDIESVEEGFDVAGALPEGYADTAEADIPEAKSRAQQRFTQKALRSLAARGTDAA